MRTIATKTPTTERQGPQGAPAPVPTSTGPPHEAPTPTSPAPDEPGSPPTGGPRRRRGRNPVSVARAQARGDIHAIRGQAIQYRDTQPGAPARRGRPADWRGKPRVPKEPPPTSGIPGDLRLPGEDRHAALDDPGDPLRGPRTPTLVDMLVDPAPPHHRVGKKAKRRLVHDRRRQALAQQAQAGLRALDASRHVMTLATQGYRDQEIARLLSRTTQWVLEVKQRALTLMTQETKELTALFTWRQLLEIATIKAAIWPQCTGTVTIPTCPVCDRTVSGPRCVTCQTRPITRPQPASLEAIETFGRLQDREARLLGFAKGPLQGSLGEAIDPTVGSPGTIRAMGVLDATELMSLEILHARLRRREIPSAPQTAPLQSHPAARPVQALVESATQRASGALPSLGPLDQKVPTILDHHDASPGEAVPTILDATPVASEETAPLPRDPEPDPSAGRPRGASS